MKKLRSVVSKLAPLSEWQGHHCLNSPISLRLSKDYVALPWQPGIARNIKTE